MEDDEDDDEREAAERADALPTELAQARKEYMEYVRNLIAEAIEEKNEATDDTVKKRTVYMDDFRREEDHGLGEDYEGLPAMLAWEFNGMNFISADLLLWPVPEYADLLGRSILEELTEELEIQGYTVDYYGECGVDLRYKITYTVG